MKRRILGTLVLGSLVALLVVLTSPAESQASETSVAQGTETAPKQNQFQFGLMSGPGIDTSASNVAMSIGGHIEYKPAPIVGLGIFGMYSGYAAQDMIVAQGNATLTMMGIEAKLYPFENDGFYLAGRLGMSTITTTLTSDWDRSLSTTSSESGLLLGGAAGYNFHAGKNFSVGPELAYFQPHSAAGNGSLFNTMVTLNYSF